MFSKNISFFKNLPELKDQFQYIFVEIKSEKNNPSSLQLQPINLKLTQSGYFVEMLQSTEVEGNIIHTNWH